MATLQRDARRHRRTASLRTTPFRATVSVVVGALAAVVCLAAAASGAPSAAGQLPAPKTSAQGRAQVTRLGEALETITERYNGAVIVLGTRRAAAKAAAAAVVKVNGELQAQQAQAQSVARTAYEGGKLTSLAAFLTSTSPQSFLDRASTLDVISGEGTAVMAELVKTKARAVSARGTAQHAATTAQQTAAKLATQKASIKRQLVALRAAISRLSAAERAALLAANGSTTRPKLTHSPSGPGTPTHPSPSPSRRRSPRRRRRHRG
ncbi:MAG: hypothetical protein DLM56_14210, partial [Pseudonocardiales bacterium]